MPDVQAVGDYVNTRGVTEFAHQVAVAAAIFKEKTMNSLSEPNTCSTNVERLYCWINILNNSHGGRSYSCLIY
jgi:hypothetical protein